MWELATPTYSKKLARFPNAHTTPDFGPIADCLSPDESLYAATIVADSPLGDDYDTWNIVVVDLHTANVTELQLSPELVAVTVSDAHSGNCYVEASYEFGRHCGGNLAQSVPALQPLSGPDDGSPILVTGASGGLAKALLARLGASAIGLSRSGAMGALALSDPADLPALLSGRRIAGIVHCAWPAPDNQRLTTLGSSTDAAVRYHVAAPLAEAIKWAGVLAAHGLPGATLVLVGSTAADPGRHNWSMPLYSIAKSAVPTLVKVLALELGACKLRCVGVVFDVIDGDGMNAGMRDAVRQGHADRSPFGVMATPREAAAQITWVLENVSTLLSGAVLTLAGGAVP
jgi:NAD(P)-dependent dehydrogenase (short-subunit alcohol dehydrogenase family)